SSNRSAEDIKAAIDSGMKLRTNARDLKQFRNYIEFIEDSKPKSALKAMKEIEEIYNYSYKTSILKPGVLQPTSKRFLANQKKVLDYEEKRFQEILDEMRMQENQTLVKEIEE